MVDLLKNISPENNSKYWPATPRALKSRIDRAKSFLRERGLTIKKKNRTGSGQFYLFTLIEKDLKEPTQPARPAQNAEKACLSIDSGGVGCSVACVGSDITYTETTHDLHKENNKQKQIVNGENVGSAGCVGRNRDYSNSDKKEDINDALVV